MISFTLTIFLSAFLLFQVQPLISRYILPWFGGAPAVWSASLVFFQVLLLAGYAYAHWLSPRTRRQLIFHIFLLAGSLLVLLLSALVWGVPLLPGPAWRPPDATAPFLRIVIVLLVSVGLPYFILSTTSPLLQSWFKFLYPQRVPYGLYALSNFASFLALISYPLLFERLLSLREQALFWSAPYAVYALGSIFLSFKVYAETKSKASLVVAEVAVPPPAEDPEQPSPPTGDTPPIPPGEPTPPSLARKLLWIALPACSSILLLSVTNQLTQEVAVIPFLWILPLSVYLLSFTVVFSGEGWYHRTLSLVLLGAATLALGYAQERVASIGVFPQIAIYSSFLFVSTWVCHGELYRLRPDPRRLTSFYLLLSLGGALGGLFVNLVAPFLFRGYWELQLGVLLCWVLVLFVLIIDRGSFFHRRWVWLAAPLILLAIGATGIFSFRQIQNTMTGVIEIQRNFYGVFRVRVMSTGDPPAETLSLSHGITTHGFQFIEPAKRRLPTTYYGRNSGIGLTLTHFPELQVQNPHPPGIRVGVIGLGAGTLAAYGNPGDYFRFYEINPGIIDLALGKNERFTYLKDTPAAFDIVPGDARLSMEHELDRVQPQNFDILAVDAFSSDSIPVHLLTAEAFGIYLRHLSPQGVLAIHISNRYLDLAPLVRALGERYSLDLALISNPRDDTGVYASTWVLLSRSQAFFEIPQIKDAMRSFPETPNPVRLWTDDYSNLLQFMRMSNFYNIR